MPSGFLGQLSQSRHPALRSHAVKAFSKLLPRQISPTSSAQATPKEATYLQVRKEGGERVRLACPEFISSAFKDIT